MPKPLHIDLKRPENPSSLFLIGLLAIMSESERSVIAMGCVSRAHRKPEDEPEGL